MSGDLKQFIESRQVLCREAYESLLTMGAWEGWYKTLSSLYPDNAHFVFELLQNAEDANATQVKFELLDGMLTFKHDGTRDFNEDDVYSITNVGDSKKGNEVNKIGKFGVGFKSVFAYTTSPKIYSKSVSFEIKHLFIPSLIDPEPIRGGYSTIFNFPFDREDKSKEDAFNEVKALFDELSDNVLLFLTNIQTIEWQIEGSSSHRITKERKNELIEITNTQKGTSCWLVFNKDFDFDGSDEPLTLSIAYSFNKEKKEIEPIRGDVSIFFPAKKESSKLKFHIDAPFSSTVARDSIVDSAENEEMLENIVTICQESIHQIRDMGLLTPMFFDVIPNLDDELDHFYMPIFRGLVEEFSSRENKLIPLKDGSYGSVDRSVFCSRRVSDTFKDKEDLNILFDDENLDGFAITHVNGSRYEKFLSSLIELNEYEDSEVFNSIYELALEISNSELESWTDMFDELHNDYAKEYIDLANKRRAWLESKSNEYIQSLYAFFHDTIERSSYELTGSSSSFSDLIHLIKYSNGEFNYGSLKSYFRDENTKSKSDLSFVNPEVYSLGSRKQQKKSKAFLERIGVEYVGESTHIEYLFYNYKFLSEIDHLKDINRLIDWYTKEKSSTPGYEVDLNKVDLHNQSFIYSESNELVRPNQTYIDDPYQFSGLRYVGNIIDKVALKAFYKKLENIDIFIEILILLGSKAYLEIQKSVISYNPEWRRMWRESKGSKETHTSVREDWNIEYLSRMLEIDENRFEVSLLIWNTLSSQAIKKYNLSAHFRKSQTYDFVTAKSTFIYRLMAYEWIPDKNRNFHKPEDIDEEMLADEFSFHEASEWLDSVEFGKNIISQKTEYQEEEKILAKHGIPKDFLDTIKKDGLTIADLQDAAKKIKSQRLATSMQSNSGSGDTPEVSKSEGLGSIITNPEGHQVNVANENNRVSGSKTPGVRNISRQDPDELKKINKFLYDEYSGHCQVCGDTFEGNDGRNVFITHSLNRSKKGDPLKSDVNRKGNSICLCPKHHLIFTLGLQAFNFIEKFEKSELSLETIQQNFDYLEDIGKVEGQEYVDFYNRPEGSSFERDVFMLPITLFSKRLYLKFTQDHIQQFIEAWNNN